MPTTKKRINITVEDWMWEAIEDYRYNKRLMSKSEAATTLIENALKAEGIPVPETQSLYLTGDTAKLVLDRITQEKEKPLSEENGPGKRHA